MSKKKLIINADDYGYSKIFNQEILKLLESSFISSTTVMVDWVDANQSDQFNKLITLRLKNNIGIGLHLVFPDSFILTWENFHKEADRQFAKFVEIFTFAPDHIDIHKPAQLSESQKYLEIFCNKRNVKFRNIDNIKSGNTTSLRCINGTTLSLEELEIEITNISQSLNKNESVEILFHPGKFDINSKSSLNKEREDDVLKIILLQPILQKLDFVLINFGELGLDVKDFKKWSLGKRNVNNFGVNKWCKPGSIWWCSLGENVGFEEDGKSLDFTRPVLVLKTFSIFSTLVIPLTTTEKKNKYIMEIGEVEGKKASVILSQIRFLDSRRLTTRIANIHDGKFLEIKKAIKNLI